MREVLYVLTALLLFGILEQNYPLLFGAIAFPVFGNVNVYIHWVGFWFASNIFIVLTRRCLGKEWEGGLQRLLISPLHALILSNGYLLLILELYFHANTLKTDSIVSVIVLGVALMMKLSGETITSIVSFNLIVVCAVTFPALQYSLIAELP